jgi:HK97 family phage major capsid protein
MSTTYLSRLHELRNSAIAVERELLDTAERQLGGLAALSVEERAAYDTIGLTADQRSTIEKARTDLTQLEATIADVRAAAERDRRIADETPDQDPEAGQRNASNKAIAAELRKVLTGDRRSLELTYQPERRAMTTTSIANSVAEPEFAEQFIANLTDRTNFLRLGPTVMTTTHGRDIKMRFDPVEGTAAWLAEAGTLAGTDPSFAAPLTFSAHKAGKLTRVSSESLEDADWAFLQYIGQEAAFALGTLLSTAYFQGDGSSKPAGLVPNATAVAGNIANLAALTFDKLIDAQHALAQAARQDAQWVTSDAAVQTLRKIKDGTNNYIYQPAVTANAPALLLGKPVTTDVSIASSGASSRPVVYGDIGRYRIRNVNTIRFERSDDRFFDTDEVGFRIVARTDGKLELAGAVVAIVATA